MQTLKQSDLYITNEMNAASMLSDAILVYRDIRDALVRIPDEQIIDTQI
ncbi:MAG: hypothetical protein LBU32_07860 [Clostridiales bacterium]|jgi:hypothetical protein|nr:hypothetical protein [Clostridiales bacterium]